MNTEVTGEHRVKRKAVRSCPDGFSFCEARYAGLRPGDSRGRLSYIVYFLSIYSMAGGAPALRFVGSDSHAVEGTVDEEEGDEEEGDSQHIRDGCSVFSLG